MPNLFHRIKLCFTRKPIVLDYGLNCTKAEFKKFIVSKISKDDWEIPFTFFPPKFVGHIKGRGRDEFEIKSNPSPWSKGSYNSTSWFYIRIEEIEVNVIDLKVEVRKTKNISLGIWAISIVFSLIFIGSIIGILNAKNSQNDFIFPLATLGFYFLFLASITSISDELEYFQDHIICPMGGDPNYFS